MANTPTEGPFRRAGGSYSDLGIVGSPYRYGCSEFDVQRFC